MCVQIYETAAQLCHWGLARVIHTVTQESVYTVHPRAPTQPHSLAVAQFSAHVRQHLPHLSHAHPPQSPPGSSPSPGANPNPNPNPNTPLCLYAHLLSCLTGTVTVGALPQLLPPECAAYTVDLLVWLLQ